MEIARSIADEHFDDEFRQEDEAKQKENEDSHRKVQHRLRTEILYQTGPFDAPELIDNRGLLSNRVRTPTEMEWAEQRLVELGFRVQLDGKVRSYTAETDDMMVYADPRESKQITFCPFKKPLLKSGKTRWGYRNTFFILDSWKNDIKGKYEKRLAEAKSRLFAVSNK